MPDVVSEAATLSLSQMEGKERLNAYPKVEKFLKMDFLVDLIEDDHHPVHGDPMLSHLLNSPRSPSSPTSSLHSADISINGHSNGISHNGLDVNCLKGDSNIEMQSDPLLSSSHHHSQSHAQTNGVQSNHHHHHHQHHQHLHNNNHVDLNSCIDPILTSTHNLLSSPHRSHVDSILSSPDDSLVNDIDMNVC